MLPAALAAATGAVFLLAPVSTETAIANGDTRTIHLHHAHTKESIDATYMVDGRYDPVALEKLNWFLRDWRRDEPTHMDPKLFDTVWEVYREAGSRQPIEVMSAYRSPETNSMLRHATRGVAEHSQHILGKAMDQHYVDVPMSRIRELAMRLQRGGVGFYPTAGTPFVHMDVGGVRHWPRMGYDQLARLFPDGKTVHIPANGQPLPGYEEARAELVARGDSFDYPTAGEVKSKGFFAWLFGGGDDEGDGEASRAGGVPRDAAPAPRRRPSVQVASADTGPVGSLGEAAMKEQRDERPTAGGSFFSIFSTKPAEPVPEAAPPAQAAAKAPRGRTQVASLPPDADAQAKLTAEMQRQAQAAEAQKQAAEAQRQAAAEAQRQAAQSAAVAQAQVAEDQKQAAAARSRTSAVPADADAEQPRAAPAPAAAGRDVPLPPRRPTEIAANGPANAAPPSRAGDAPANRGDRAPAPGTARAAIASAVPPSARAGLPAAITQGLGQPPAAPRALGFAPSSPPVPVARPPLVAARLDRSNFHSLTGSTSADRLPARSGVGSAVAALRPAAQASAASLGDGAGGPRRGFGARATDLSTGSFSGSAVTAQERVSTATPHKRPAVVTSDD